MRGPIAYIGGKSRLAPTLIPLFPAHDTYVEPFAGGAQVFFRKTPSRVEVLNDLDGELVNFLRVCQQHHIELLRWLSYTVASRRLYNLCREQRPELLTDVQRAARFLYLQRMTWGAQVIKRSYGLMPTEPSRFRPSQLPAMLEQTAKRLEGVQLENWPYEKVLTAYDRPDAFFYCDPPYVDRPFYRFNLTAEDYAALAQRLTKLRGKFLLSINDHPVAREAFKCFEVREVRVLYTSWKRANRSRELVFANYELPKELAGLSQHD